MAGRAPGPEETGPQEEAALGGAAPRALRTGASALPDEVALNARSEQPLVLSWQNAPCAPGSGEGAARGRTQASFAVDIMARGSDRGSHSNSDSNSDPSPAPEPVWSSGTVQSQEQEVVVPPSTLQPDKDYTWTVRVQLTLPRSPPSSSAATATSAQASLNFSTALAPGDPATGRVSDRDLARIFDSGDPRATIRITANPRHRMDPPTDDRSRGRFSEDAKAAPSAGEQEQDLRSMIRAIPGADEQAMMNQIRQGIQAAFAPVIGADGRQPKALQQLQRILTQKAWPTAPDREFPSFR